MGITIKDIAKKANVSYSTVSRALAGHNQISNETKNRILKISEELGYSPNTLAQGLVTKQTFNLGLIVSDITNPFFPEVIQGIEESANDLGYRIYLCNTNWSVEKENIYLNRLFTSSVDGIIIFPASDDVSHIINSKIKIPIVFANHKLKDDACSYVAFNDYEAAKTAVEYLIKLGHKNIAYVGGLETNVSNMERIRGYQEVMKNHSIELHPNYIVNGEFKQSSGYQLTKDLLIKNAYPTAIVAGDDVMALGVIQAVEEFGLNVPNDISVIGFDDISYAALDKIQLTTINMPKYEMGKASIQLLMERIHEQSKCKTKFKILETELILRKTCNGIRR